MSILNRIDVKFSVKYLCKDFWYMIRVLLKMKILLKCLYVFMAHLFSKQFIFCVRGGFQPSRIPFP